MYGLKQAPRAWYKRLSHFLLKNVLKRGKVDTIIFYKSYKNYILTVQIYVDDIIFGFATLYWEFSKSMQAEIEMSMMRELKFFMGIQINQGP